MTVFCSKAIDTGCGGTHSITTRRSGWDCLRHYEIAANGSVICFKNLEQKNPLCAPHGLLSNVNCLSYKNYNELMNKIECLTENQYLTMQKKSMEWIRSKTTTILVKSILSHYQAFLNNG